MPITYPTIHVLVMLRKFCGTCGRNALESVDRGPWRCVQCGAPAEHLVTGEPQ